MSLRFEATTSPTAQQLDALAHLSPHSPFHSAPYAEARAALGDTSCLLGLYNESELVTGCIGFLRGRRFARSLEITSAPALSTPEPFWAGVRGYCRKQRVWDLHIESYAAKEVSLPSWPGEVSRRQRLEFVLDLSQPIEQSMLSSGHRRNVGRARRHGLTIDRSCDPAAARAHSQLIESSMQRRRLRGEALSTHDQTQFFEAMLRIGAAEVFRANDGANLLSSIMLLRSKEGAYYQSAGTSPEGMQKGASHYLVFEAACALKDAEIRAFNLGGAQPEDAGLQRFKSGFGAREIPLEAAEFCLVSPVKRKLRSAARLARNQCENLLRPLVRDRKT